MCMTLEDENYMKASYGVCPCCNGSGKVQEYNANCTRSYTEACDHCNNGILESKEDRMYWYPEIYGEPFSKCEYKDDSDLEIVVSKNNSDYFVKYCNSHILKENMHNEVYGKMSFDGEHFIVTYKGKKQLKIPLDCKVILTNQYRVISYGKEVENKI